jgi:phosphatidylserine decarboxylase
LGHPAVQEFRDLIDNDSIVRLLITQMIDQVPDTKLYTKLQHKPRAYSLGDMLAGDDSADLFVGGSEYQAYLDAHKYHRWHNPVSGTIRKAFVRKGTYYSEAESERKDPDDMNNPKPPLVLLGTKIATAN